MGGCVNNERVYVDERVWCHLAAPLTTVTLGDGSARRPTSSHSIALILRVALRMPILQKGEREANV